MYFISSTTLYYFPWNVRFDRKSFHGKRTIFSIPMYAVEIHCVLLAPTQPLYCALFIPKNFFAGKQAIDGETEKSTYKPKSVHVENTCDR